jgi:hypothetical protein
MSRKSAVAIISLGGVLLAIGAFEVVSYRTPVSRPLGEAPPIDFHSAKFSESERQHFLDGIFKVVKDVRALPAPVLQTFMEDGGTRLLIANPGEKFDATDVISGDVPRKQLIIAGVAEDKCFVHYYQGGRAAMYVVEFFRLSSSQNIEPLWKGHCDTPARDIGALRLCLNTYFQPNKADGR